MDKKLVETFYTYLEENQISQNKAAQLMNYSPSVLSAYKNGTYQGDLAEVEERMKRFLKTEENRRRVLSIEIQDISILKKIKTAINIAYEEHDIAVIVGDAGIGKTTALEQYVKNSLGAARMIKVNKTFTMHTLIRKIAAAVGVSQKGATSVMTERIIEYLQSHKMVLIFDEADHLSDNSLEYLRQVVYDAGETALVLCGIDRLAGTIRNSRKDHDQLLSRVGMFCYLEGVQDNDLKLVIDSVYPRLDKDLVKHLIAQSKMKFHSEGEPSLRALTKILKRLHRYLWKVKKAVPDIESIDSVANLIMRRTV